MVGKILIKGRGRETTEGVELQVVFVYTGRPNWKGTVWIPLRDPILIEKELKKLFKSHEPAVTPVELPDEIEVED